MHRVVRSTPPESRGEYRNTRRQDPPRAVAQPPAHRRQGACSGTARPPPYSHHALPHCRGWRPNPDLWLADQPADVPRPRAAHDPNPQRAYRRACRRGEPSPTPELRCANYPDAGHPREKEHNVPCRWERPYRERYSRGCVLEKSWFHPTWKISRSKAEWERVARASAPANRSKCAQSPFPKKGILTLLGW